MVGIALFCQSKFEAANQYLFNSSFDIRELIFLFQSLIPISNLAPKFTSRFSFKINLNANNELNFKLALLNIFGTKIFSRSSSSYLNGILLLLFLLLFFYYFVFIIILLLLLLFL